MPAPSASPVALGPLVAFGAAAQAAAAAAVAVLLVPADMPTAGWVLGMLLAAVVSAFW